MKKIKIQLSKKSAEELADLKIKLGFARLEDRDFLIKLNRTPMECLVG
jgi:hypothetical protein